MKKKNLKKVNDTTLDKVGGGEGESTETKDKEAVKSLGPKSKTTFRGKHTQKFKFVIDENDSVEIKPENHKKCCGCKKSKNP